MPQCEICGSDKEYLTEIQISESSLDVCEDCEALGTEVSETNNGDTEDGREEQTPEPEPNITQTPGNHHQTVPEEDLVIDFDDRIQQAREDLEISHEELSEEIDSDKEFIKDIEKGEAAPTEEIVEDLEDYLEIDLVQEPEYTEEDFYEDYSYDTSI